MFHCLARGLCVSGQVYLDAAAKGLAHLVWQVVGRCDSDGDLMWLGVTLQADVAADEGRYDDQGDQNRLEPDLYWRAAGLFRPG
jgi:hypothetical protein